MNTFPTTFHGYTLTKEEEAVLDETLKKMREERHKAEVFEENREWLRSAVSSIIDAIGEEDTKRILREINRDLRKYHESQSDEEELDPYNVVR